MAMTIPYFLRLSSIILFVLTEKSPLFEKKDQAKITPFEESGYYNDADSE